MDMLKTYDGRMVRLTPAMVAVVETLEEARAGGFAFLKKAVFETGREKGKPTVANVWFTSRYSYAALLERKAKALDAMTACPGVDAETFSVAKEELLRSARQTLMGDRSGAAREAHDRCYIKVCDGVYIHLDAEEVDGRKEPILTDGIPTGEAILVQALEVKRRLIEAGQKKPVKSSSKTLAKRAIEKATGVKMPRRYTLKPGRFESLSIDNNVITEDQITEDDD